jgi:hypothetical protein
MTLYKLPAGEGRDSLVTDVTHILELDGITYDLRFRWNTRDESWTVICSKSGSTPIFSTKVKTNVIFNSIYKHRTDAPQGDMIIIDMSETNGRVDFDNFTIEGRYRLLYNSII